MSRGRGSSPVAKENLYLRVKRTIVHLGPKRRATMPKSIETGEEFLKVEELDQENLDTFIWIEEEFQEMGALLPALG